MIELHEIVSYTSKELQHPHSFGLFSIPYHLTSNKVAIFLFLFLNYSIINTLRKSHLNFSRIHANYTYKAVFIDQFYFKFYLKIILKVLRLKSNEMTI